MDKKEMGIVIEEIARVALEISDEIWDVVGDELGLSNAELGKVHDYLENKRFNQLEAQEEDPTIEQLEAALERTRKEICNQLSTVDNGYYRSIQSIDPSLYRREREQARAIINAQLKSQEQDQ